MTCPKCHGQMRQYERAGVTIDQCSECRGIFLDRGELERLVDAEDSYGGHNRSGYAAPPASYPSQQHGYQSGPAHGHSSYGYQHGHRRHKGHRRKKSLFDDLFG